MAVNKPVMESRNQCSNYIDMLRSLLNCIDSCSFYKDCRLLRERWWVVAKGRGWARLTHEYSEINMQFEHCHMIQIEPQIWYHTPPSLTDVVTLLYKDDLEKLGQCVCMHYIYTYPCDNITENLFSCEQSESVIQRSTLEHFSQISILPTLGRNILLFIMFKRDSRTLSLPCTKATERRMWWFGQIVFRIVYKRSTFDIWVKRPYGFGLKLC